MYDVSAEFNKFYRNEVVLHSADQHELRRKKRLNIKRLKSGLQEYNEEKGTSYKICEDRVQGSMAMHTVVQNDEKDYDTSPNGWTVFAMARLPSSRRWPTSWIFPISRTLSI